MILDHVKIALSSLKNRKLRSSLTVLGIVIGVAAIISLIAISSGLQNAIEEQFSQFGSTRIFVFPKSAAGGAPGMSGTLTEDDYDALNRLSYFEFVTPYTFSSSKIEYKREEVNTYILGVPTENQEQRFEAFDLQLAEGRFMNSGDDKVVIIGWRVSKKMFSSELKTRSKITIDGEKYEVIGVFEELGSKTDDEQIYMPIDDMRQKFGLEGKVNLIEAKIKPGQDPEEIAAKMRRVLERERGDEMFDVQTPDQIMKQLDAILGILQVVLVGIAFISLIVGAVGIMNSMYTSVLERTKEIGIMKSIGATRRDILTIFVLEAGILGIIGGVVGLALGAGLAFGVEAIGKQAGFPLLVRIPVWLSISGIAFAFIVGTASGILPAKQASQLNAVDALKENT